MREQHRLRGRMAALAIENLDTDQIMPKLTGLDLAAELTRIRPDIPILLATGRPDLALAERGRLAGIREVLKKPLLIRELAEAISRVWAAERGRRGSTPR